MNHRKHMIPCLIALAIAMTLFATAGANPLAAGVGLAFLLCPIVMGAAMWLLMRQPTRSVPAENHTEQATHAPVAGDSRQVSGRSRT